MPASPRGQSWIAKLGMLFIICLLEELCPMSFSVFEASIADLHRAIQRGETTCVEVVEQYLARVTAFNGPTGLLVTSDGAPVVSGPGTIKIGRAHV